MATIQEVARQAGVSISTVSRVVNGVAPVTPEVASRVRAVIQSLNDRPSSAARAMRAQRSKIIGILISDIQNPFFTGLICGAEDVAQLNGCSLILCNSDEDPQKERRYVEVLCAEQVAGVIIVPTQEHARSLRLFHDHSIPVVAVDRRVKDREIDAVMVDNVRGAREAVAHLIENGYRITASTRLFQRVQHGSSLTRQEMILAPTLCARGSSQPREPISAQMRPASA